MVQQSNSALLLQGSETNRHRSRLDEATSFSIEGNKEIVRALFAPLGEVLKQHDALYSSDWIGHFPGMPPLDENGHRQYAQAMMTAFPNLERTIVDIVGEGNRVVARWEARGKHEGMFQGLPPTGKIVTSSSITIFRLENGRVAEEWSESDMLGMLQQLGVLPSMGGAPTESDNQAQGDGRG